MQECGGNATTTSANILSWIEFPVRVIEDRAIAGTSNLKDKGIA